MSRCSMFEAAIFDLDGLLINSEPHWRRAEIAAFHRINVKLTDSMCQRTQGLRLDEMLQFWRLRFPTIEFDIADLRREIITQLRESYGRSLELMPGAESALQIAQNLDMSVALCSSSPLELIDHVIAKIDPQHEIFTAVHSAEVNEWGKPHPQPYLSAAARMGVDPARCIGFEDSENGGKSAKAAGLYTVLVGNIHRKIDENAYSARLHSLSELTETLTREFYRRHMIDNALANSQQELDRQES